MSKLDYKFENEDIQEYLYLSLTWELSFAWTKLNGHYTSELGIFPWFYRVSQSKF